MKSVWPCATIHLLPLLHRDASLRRWHGTRPRAAARCVRAAWTPLRMRCDAGVTSCATCLVRKSDGARVRGARLCWTCWAGQDVLGRAGRAGLGWTCWAGQRRRVPCRWERGRASARAALGDAGRAANRRPARRSSQPTRPSARIPQRPWPASHGPRLHPGAACTPCPAVIVVRRASAAASHVQRVLAKCGLSPMPACICIVPSQRRPKQRPSLASSPTVLHAPRPSLSSSAFFLPSLPAARRPPCPPSDATLRSTAPPRARPRSHLPVRRPRPRWWSCSSCSHACPQWTISNWRRGLQLACCSAIAPAHPSACFSPLPSSLLPPPILPPPSSRSRSRPSSSSSPRSSPSPCALPPRSLAPSLPPPHDSTRASAFATMEQQRPPVRIRQIHLPTFRARPPACLPVYRVCLSVCHPPQAVFRPRQQAFAHDAHEHRLTHVPGAALHCFPHEQPVSC